MPTNQGSIRLFRIAGVDVFLHWSWFLVAIIEINSRAGGYSSALWNVLEYLALFLIVLLHEFGHALACRQVGGKANRIVLWPLGGVAYVSPPPRPGATLWSIAAGPLVNAALVPVLLGLRVVSGSAGWAHSWPDLDALLQAVSIINAGLLVFNMLPIYPLDGGQVLRSLLWFALGRARSLMVATIFGFVGLAGYFLLALMARSVWLGILGVFLLLNCWGGLRSAQALARIAKAPRRNDFACPSCKAGPPVGENWRCSTCKQTFDTFETQAVCPHCSTQFPVTQCFECGNASPIGQWVGTSASSAGA
ncbi:MAG TPA: M50 family metallopeptidase [Terriglobales bacterium]|jgi:Zn-dependent protease|nr:M50 family metallopeptidase [Terriglobales bacterium]